MKISERDDAPVIKGYIMPLECFRLLICVFLNINVIIQGKQSDFNTHTVQYSIHSF